VHALHLKDYFTLENSLTGNIGAPTPAVMSFKVVWKNATGSVNNYNNSDQQFRGDYRHDLEGYEPNFGCPKKFML
jgi:hypothetical protein